MCGDLTFKYNYSLVLGTNQFLTLKIVLAIKFVISSTFQQIQSYLLLHIHALINIYIV